MKPRVKRFKTQVLSATPTRLVLQTVQKWQQDECSEMGAALAYYALFSLFPTFLVFLSIAGFFLGPETDVVDQILTYARTVLPPLAYETFEDALSHLNESSIGAGITGFILLLFTSSNVFGALDRSVDKIWKVYDDKRNSSSWQSSAITFVLDRVLAVSLVLSVSALMLISLVLNLVLKLLRYFLDIFNQLITVVKLDEVWILSTIQLGVTFLILYLGVLILFKILPSTSVRWSDIWLGGLITSGLLVGLQQLISRSVIHLGTEYQSYGLIGGVMVLMLWLYLTCQIFFFGSAFTYVYAHLYGSRRDRPRFP